MTARRPWLLLGVGIVACLCMVVPARIFASSLPNANHLFVGAARIHVGHRLMAADLVWWGLFAVAVSCLLRAPRRAAAAVGVGCSVVIGAASIARHVVISNDVYRYVWDGRVQAAGIDPYRYAPSASQLDRLHDSWLWPNAATCAIHLQQAGCTLINRANVHTIYPPLAQIWFLLEHYVVPQSTRDIGYEVVGLVIAVSTSLLLLVTLSRLGRDIRWVAIWGCCPAVAVEIVQSAHVDGLAALIVVGGIYAAERSHWRWAAIAIGAAGLIKLYPLALFPTAVRRDRIKGAVIIAGMFVVSYVPHVIAVGKGVTGFLSGFLHQEGYDTGARYQLLRLFGLHGKVASVVAVFVVLSLIGLALLDRLGSPATASMILFTGMLLVATPGEPWEDITVVALAALTGAWQWVVVVIADDLGYLAFIFGGLSRAVDPRLWGAALAIGALTTAFVLLRRRQHSPFGAAA